MLIVCPSCATSYDIELASLVPSGRQVRCVRCRSVWHATPTKAQMLVAAADAIGSAPHGHERVTQTIAQEEVFQRPGRHSADAAAYDAWPGGPSQDEADAAEPGDVVPDPAAASTEPGSVEGEYALADPQDDAGEVEAPSLAPADFGDGGRPIDGDAENGAEQATAPRRDIETAAARRYRHSAKTKSWWPLSRLQSAMVALIVLDAIVVGWRADLVRIFPQTAAFYGWLGLAVNVRGLGFDAISITTEQHEGVPILVVEGSVVNGAHKIVDVPRLKFAVRNAARQEIYSWTAVPPRSSLPAGEAVTFRTRLASPPPDGRDVLVRFVNRRDVLAGTR